MFLHVVHFIAQVMETPSMLQESLNRGVRPSGLHQFYLGKDRVMPAKKTHLHDL
jgi:hypothetical protein